MANTFTQASTVTTAKTEAQKVTSFTATFEAVPDKTQAAADYNYAGLTKIIKDMANTGGVINVRNGPHLRQSLGVTSSRILFQSNGENEPWTWEPTTPGQTLFQWFYRRYDGADGLSGNYVVSPMANSEGQLENCGARGVVVLGNRVNKANAWRMVGTDHGFFQDCQVRGVAGFALDAQNVREFNVQNFITRFNGWVDPNDPSTGVANMYLAGNYMPENYGVNRENSNLNTWENVQLTFSFYHELVVNGAFYNSFDGFLIHQLPRANYSLETIIATQFPDLRLGGASTPANQSYGWDASGTPKNPYAALHQGAANVAAVNSTDNQGTAPRNWLRGFGNAKGILNMGQSRMLRLDNGRIVGAGTPNVVTNVDSSSISFGQVDATAAGASEWTVSMDSIGNGLFTASYYSGGLAVLPETGTTVGITALSSSPLPFLQGSTFYLIRVSDTTFRLATTYQNALDSVAATFTATGAGLRFRMGGEVFASLKNSELVLSGLGEYSDGRIAAFADPTSIITERKTTTSTWAEGPGLPSSREIVKIGEARGINLKNSGDYLFKKICQGNRVVPVSLVIDRYSGGVRPNAAKAAIYTAAGGTGTQLGTSYSLNALWESGQAQTYNIDPTVSVVFEVVNGGSGATAVATVDNRGVVTGITVTAGGTGYTSAPLVYIRGVKAKAAATVSGGVVTAVSLTTTGNGYSTAPTVTVVGGGGTGAVVTATTDGDVITGFTITNAGSGYTTAPTLVITGGGGRDAAATAVLSGNTVGSIVMAASGGGWVYTARQMDDHIVSPAVTPVAPWYFRITTAAANDMYANAFVYGYVLD